MMPARITDHTRALGAPLNWDPERDGTCGVLLIRDVVDEAGGRRMLSLWEPDPAELDRIKAGAKVILSVTGTAHPPVWLAVADVPEDAAEMTEEQALASGGDVRRHKKGGLYRVLLVDRVGRAWCSTWAGNREPVLGEDLVLYEHLWPHRHALYQRPRAEFEEPGRFERIAR